MSESLVALATKLVAFAQEQDAALARSATSQFDWLALRRAEVTGKLETLLAGGPSLTLEEASAISGLRDELAIVDRGMEERVQGMLQKAHDVQTALRRERRSLGGYLRRVPRIPSFVDKRR